MVIVIFKIVNKQFFFESFFFKVFFQNKKKKSVCTLTIAYSKNIID